MLAKLFRDFMLIWTTVDPIGNLAIFSGLTASLSRAERNRVARRASIYAAIILIGAVIAGQIILDAMGIPYHEIEEDADVGRIKPAIDDAYAGSRPVVLLIGRRPS